MSENKCLGYTMSVAGRTIKVNECGNMAQLREQDARIYALEAENAALHSRLEFTACQKADVEAQVLELEEQNAALRRVVSSLKAIFKQYWPLIRPAVTRDEAVALVAALAAAGLMAVRDNETEEEGK